MKPSPTSTLSSCMIKISFTDTSTNYTCKNPHDIGKFMRDLQDEKPFIMFRQNEETVYINKSSIKKLVIKDEI